MEVPGIIKRKQLVITDFGEYQIYSLKSG